MAHTSISEDAKGPHEYVNAVDDSLCCTICLTAMNEPVVAPCGHSFCKNCIESWLQQPKTSTCPECRHQIRKNQLQRVVALKKLIDGLEVYCPKRSAGCKMTVRRDALESHLSQCDFCKVPCPTCGNSAKRETIDAHLHKESREASEREAESAELKAETARLKAENIQLKTEVEKYEEKATNLEAQADFCRGCMNTVIQAYEEKIEHFDESYGYGTEKTSVCKLSRFISQNMENRPADVNRLRLFSCIQRSYRRWKTVDTVMLAATALASGWFTSNQDERLGDWIDDLIVDVEI